MNINDAFNAKHLIPADVRGFPDRTYTIADVKSEAVGDGKVPVLYFTQIPKGLALDRRNAAEIERGYGSETANWIGKSVSLFAIGSGDGEVIRVRYIR